MVFNGILIEIKEGKCGFGNLDRTGSAEHQISGINYYDHSLCQCDRGGHVTATTIAVESVYMTIQLPIFHPPFPCFLSKFSSIFDNTLHTQGSSHHNRIY